MVEYKEIAVNFIEYIDLIFENNYYTVIISANGKEYRRMFKTLETAKKHFNMIQEKLKNIYILLN